MISNYTTLVVDTETNFEVRPSTTQFYGSLRVSEGHASTTTIYFNDVESFEKLKEAINGYAPPA